MSRLLRGSEVNVEAANDDDEIGSLDYWKLLHLY